MAKSAPTLVVASVNAVSGSAAVTKPALDTWATYRLEICEQANPTACRVLPACTIAATGTVTLCPLPGCVAQTAYTVKATAYATDNSASSVSAPANFTTPQHA